MEGACRVTEAEKWHQMMVNARNAQPYPNAIFGQRKPRTALTQNH